MCSWVWNVCSLSISLNSGDVAIKILVSLYTGKVYPGVSLFLNIKYSKECIALSICLSKIPLKFQQISKYLKHCLRTIHILSGKPMCKCWEEHSPTENKLVPSHRWSITNIIKFLTVNYLKALLASLQGSYYFYAQLCRSGKQLHKYLVKIK